MEKTIKSIIDSYLQAPERHKLIYLDNLLFSFLLNKEIYLLENKKDGEVRKIERILSKYYNYRDILYRTIAKSKKVKTELIKDIFIPASRLVFLLTHDCQLRCKYCKVRKFSSSMDEEVLFKGIDLLLTSQSKKLQIQFFGGEPLLNYSLLEKGVEYAVSTGRRKGKEIEFLLTTNGIELTKEKVDFFKKYNFTVEYSIDGEVENQLHSRRSPSGKNYYSKMINNFVYLKKAGIPYYSISVVMPENVSSMFDNFLSLVKSGFEKLQINYALGVFWDQPAIRALFSQTAKIIEFIRENKGVEFINLGPVRREPVVLNAELTVDCDAKIYLESGICLEEDFAAMKNKFKVADAYRAKDINFLTTSQFQNFYNLSKVYGQVNPLFRKIIVNNIILGKRYGKFLKDERRERAK